MGARVLRVQGHEALLDREDQVVCRTDRGRSDRRVAPAEANLQRADRLSQSKRGFILVEESERLDLVEQGIGLGKKKAAMNLGGQGHAGTIRRGGRRCQVAVYKSGNTE
jgi:hypothetical protein